MVGHSRARRAGALAFCVLSVAACGAAARPTTEPPVSESPATPMSEAPTSSSPSLETEATSTPALPTPTRSLTVGGPCTAGKLAISVVDTAAGLGTAGGWLRFVNTGTEACTLHGWPTLIGTSPAETTTSRHTNALLTFPSLEGVPTVTLDPGSDAFAAFAGADNPGGPTQTCPPDYTSLRVAPPGSEAFVSVSPWNVWLDTNLPACAGIEVTMVIPASAVPDLKPLHP